MPIPQDFQIKLHIALTSKQIGRTMKAQVFRGVNQLSYEEIPVPELRS